MLKKGDIKTNSKLRKVEKYLKEHGSIDKATAVAKFDEYYLPQVISELKQQGNDIRFVNGKYIYQEQLFHVGDRVQFKTWEEMVEEFGVDACNCIKCRSGFIPEMKHLCGTYATIFLISNAFVRLKDFTEHSDIDWVYSIDMIKPAISEPKLTTEKWEQIKNDYSVEDKPSILPDGSIEAQTEDRPKTYYVVVAIHNYGNQISYDIENVLFEDETKAKEYAEFGKRLDTSIIDCIIKAVSKE